ncbi:MAG: hypothetical protein ACLQBY_00715 [Solirubrobacteraceae bacterium]
MYHVELRQFPHNMCRFNLTDAELRAIVEPWAREQVVEFGERKWSSQMARITILDGPRMPLEQLTMGRGWRAAQRQSQDVTDKVLAAARDALAAAPPPVPALAASQPPSQAATPAQPAPLADPLALGVQLASLLGEDPGRLLSAWREVAARSSGLSPSESLALAERQIRS